MNPAPPAYLAAAIERKRLEIPRFKAAESAALSQSSFPARDCTFMEAVTRPTEWVNVIAEFMRRSDIVRALKLDLAVKTVAKTYTEHGVSALSIFVDSAFGGKYEDLTRARKVSNLPILCMDFIIDRRQLALARESGADAVLFITQMLDPSELNDLILEAYELDMEPVVEVGSSRDIRSALDSGAKIIGINNRSFDNMEVYLSRTVSIAREVPSNFAIISESGIESREQIKYLLDNTDHRVRAVLVGSALASQRSVSALTKKVDELTSRR